MSPLPAQRGFLAASLIHHPSGPQRTMFVLCQVRQEKNGCLDQQNRCQSAEAEATVSTSRRSLLLAARLAADSRGPIHQPRALTRKGVEVRVPPSAPLFLS